jgi:hypothetical protein
MLRPYRRYVSYRACQKEIASHSARSYAHQIPMVCPACHPSSIMYWSSPSSRSSWTHARVWPS